MEQEAVTTKTRVSRWWSIRRLEDPDASLFYGACVIVLAVTVLLTVALFSESDINTGLRVADFVIFFGLVALGAAAVGFFLTYLVLLVAWPFVFAWGFVTEWRRMKRIVSDVGRDYDEDGYKKEETALHTYYVSAHGVDRVKVGEVKRWIRPPLTICANEIRPGEVGLCARPGERLPPKVRAKAERLIKLDVDQLPVRVRLKKSPLAELGVDERV